jgi:regulator of protease activity HflC (stomatin/prohibitin superfamily)
MTLEADYRNPHKPAPGRGRIKLIVGVAIAALVIITGLLAYFSVQQNQVAVVTQFGKAVRLAGPGLNFKLPWVETANTYRTDILELVPTKHANTYTVDNQEVDISYTVFYVLPKDRLLYLFEHVQDYESRLASLSNDRVKTAFGHANAQKIAGDRGSIRDAIFSTLKTDAVHLGVEVVDFQLTDLQYKESFRNAVGNAAVQKANIEAVEYQRQQAEKTAQMVKIAAEGEANAAREKARGSADATLLQAEATAKGIQLKGEAEAKAIEAQGKAISTNPTYVEYKKADRWNGELPKSMLSSVMPFMNVDQHLRP